MSLFDSIYSHLPIPAQHAAVSAYGLYWRWLRFGGDYQKYAHEYLAREAWTDSQWKAWQSEKLRALLAACAHHVPYYREHWDETQTRAAREGNLSALPLLEKEPLRAAPDSFLREDMRPFHPQVFYTSGSTGTPIACTYTLEELRESLAVRETRSARWAGVSFGKPRATFSGRMVEPNPNSHGPFHRFNLAERQVYFSPFHLRAETAAQYVDALRRHKVEWGTGYAVSFYLLARFMLEQNIPAPNLKAIVTTSEKLTRDMRAVMERAYGCRVYEEYSTVENAIFASECAQGRLHVSPDVAAVEILRPDGSACEAGEAGEVVVTPLSRVYQPFVRYRLGDVAAWDAEACPCGRAMPVIKEVIGRIEDVVVGPDGRQMVRFHGIFVNQPHIREGQIVQEALDRIRVKVVTTEEFSEADVTDIQARVRQRLGAGVDVIVESVASIPRAKAGKFRAVVSQIK